MLNNFAVYAFSITQVVEILHATSGSPEIQELRQTLQAPHCQASARQIRHDLPISRRDKVGGKKKRVGKNALGIDALLLYVGYQQCVPKQVGLRCEPSLTYL